jgi:hypothetical protein
VPTAMAWPALRGLAIVDANGKTRVRLEAPLPEPVIMGVQRKRDDSVSGVMIYDALGNERGGYVTDNSVGNAFSHLTATLAKKSRSSHIRMEVQSSE